MQRGWRAPRAQRIIQFSSSSSSSSSSYLLYTSKDPSVSMKTGMEGGLVVPKEGHDTNVNQRGVSFNSHADVTSSSSSPSLKKEKEKKKKKKVVSVGFLKLFHFANRTDYLLLGFGAIGSIVHGTAFPAFFYVFGALIEGFGNNQNDVDLMVSQVNKYVKAFVYVGIVLMFSSWIDVACWMHSAERQVTKMRAAYLEAILCQDISFFDTQVETGSLVESMSTNTLLVQDAIGEKMGNFIHFMTTCVGGFVVGFIANWKLALVMLVVLPIIALTGILQVYTLIKLTTQGQKAYGEAGSIADQALNQIRTVYSFVGESKILRAYSERLKVTLKLGYKASMAKGLGMGSVFGILFCSWALIVWYAGVLIRNNEANGGKAISAIFAIIIGGTAIGQGLSNLTAFGQGKAALQAIMEVIEKKEKMDDKSTNGKSLSDVKGNIEICNVNFSYPSRPDVTIFQNFSIHIASGQTVAMVGGSGSGKSTVISLIERFYDPTQGQVLLDAVDIRELQLKWLRDQIGLVNQEPALFATSIKENILYGKPGASMHEIEQAAQAANAHGFISQFPQSYETQVGERGIQLSGGQKQRIAIARAVLKNPKILLLDEATSALDVLSEKVVQEALDRLMVRRTTVVVAHRLSTIQNVDTIAVLEEGKVVEMGSHEGLMEKGTVGKYAALVKLQEMSMSSNDYILTPSLSRLKSMERLSSSKSLQFSFSGKTLSFQDKIPSLISEEEPRKSKDENGEKKQSKRCAKSVYWRLLKLSSPEWPYAILGSLGSILSGFVNPFFAFIISEIIKVYYDTDFDKMRREIKNFSLMYVGAGVGSVGAYILQRYFFGIVGENLTARVRELMLAAMLKNEVGWFDKDENNSSILASRLSVDATNVRGAIGDRVSLLLQSLSAFLTTVLIALVVEWRLALVLLATFPLLVGAAIGQKLLLTGLSGNLEATHLRATRVAGEAVENIRTVSAFNAQTKVLQLYRSELFSLEQRSLMRGNVAGAGYGVMQLCMFSSYGLALWYGSVLVKRGISDFGNVIKVFMVVIATAFAVSDALSLTPDFAKGGQALLSVFSILDRSTLIDSDDNRSQYITDSKSIKGDIEFHNVDFAYPTRPEVSVLKGLNMRVKAGENIALVGASGCGKSSIIALIERFYDPLSGLVTIDGIDIKNLHLRSLRRRIALVQQEPSLFANTVYYNIVYGVDTAGDNMINSTTDATTDNATSNVKQASVENAAKVANAHGFISGLPEGYETVVGERGVQLSGGQKQRVAIARAILKDPCVLLLDEATSALDVESEKVVQEALDRVMKGRTSIIVAHRLSTIRGASLIAVVQDGRIVEMGTHNQLILNPHGPYAHLLNLQSLPSSSSSS